jgi:hypothetical protein
VVLYLLGHCGPAGANANLPLWREFRRPRVRAANQRSSEDTSRLGAQRDMWRTKAVGFGFAPPAHELELPVNARSSAKTLPRGSGRSLDRAKSAEPRRPESITSAMSVADEFRAKARKCFERAKRAPDIEYQQLFRDLAVQWLAMAAEADASASIDPPELPPSDEGKPAGESGGSGLTGLTQGADCDRLSCLALALPEP